MRSVDVAVPPVVDAIVKSGVFATVVAEFEIENTEYGVVVPTPTFPLFAMKSVEVPMSEFVPLKYATCPCVPEKRDEVAMLKVPDVPPTREPSVPEYERPSPSVGELVEVKASAFPAAFEYRSEFAVKEVRPVPPPDTPSVPLMVGARVKAPATLVMLRPTVRPLVVWEEVAKVRAPV